MQKDYRKIVKELRKQGFTVDESGKNYPKVFAPDGSFITTVPQTPSDRRAIRNFIGYCRRAGFIWPAK